MAPDTTPSGRKRPRQANENGSSRKKRRPNAAESSPAKGLHAIASAISGVFGFGRQASRSEKELDASYEVPESDDETTSAKSRGSLPAKKASVRRKADRRVPSVYDITDSGDESGTGAASQGPRALQNTPTKPRSYNGSSGVKRKERRARPLGEQAEEDDTDATIDEASYTHEPEEQRRSSRQPNHPDVDDDATEDEQTVAGAEDQEAPTPTGGKSSGRKKRDPLSQLAIDGTPKLQGILTPSRRDRGSARSTPRKNVAFDIGGSKGRKEVFFEDLPTKPAKAKKATKASPVVPAVRDTADEEDEEASNSEEEEEEDDEVCAVCEKPDSKAPNQIIFCDNCDMAVHQKCYGVPVIPKGDWLCRDCAQDDLGGTTRGDGANKGAPARAADGPAPDIPNFDRHLSSLQRVLLDRCTGQRRIKLRGQDEAYDKTLQLVEQTVVAGEGNSMLIIGARGCGKTALVESVVSDISKKNGDDFHVVRLSGFVHTDDKLALKEIWRQLGKEMEVEDEVIGKTNNYADTLASLLALLSHPSEISQAHDGVTSKSVVFVIDEFDLFATHARQTLLYNLFDIAQARKAPIAVLGLTTRIDVVESLEKRVKSRFSHRYVYLSLPKSLPAYWDVCRQGLAVDDEDVADAGLDVTLQGHSAFRAWWDKKIEALHKDAAFQRHLEYHFYSSKSVSAFWTTCILPLAAVSPSRPSLRIGSETRAGARTEPADSKLHVLESLSELDLSLLIAAARLDIVAHMDTVNFAMAYDEYTALMGKQRVQSATAGLLAAGGGARVWGRGVAGMAWERLAALSLLVPAAVGARSASTHGGLDAKMWKVDVALEEIPGAVKLSAVLARWCREI